MSQVFDPIACRSLQCDYGSLLTDFSVKPISKTNLVLTNSIAFNSYVSCHQLELILSKIALDLPLKELLLKSTYFAYSKFRRLKL